MGGELGCWARRIRGDDLDFFFWENSLQYPLFPEAEKVMLCGASANTGSGDCRRRLRRWQTPHAEMTNAARGDCNRRRRRFPVLQAAVVKEVAKASKGPFQSLPSGTGQKQSPKEAPQTVASKIFTFSAEYFISKHRGTEIGKLKKSHFSVFNFQFLALNSHFFRIFVADFYLQNNYEN